MWLHEQAMILKLISGHSTALIYVWQMVQLSETTVAFFFLSWTQMFIFFVISQLNEPTCLELIEAL